MKVAICQWGNSAAVRIPQGLLSELGLKVGQRFDVRIERGALIMQPIHQRYELQDLLAQITPDNLHGEINYGPAKGNEIW